MKTLWCWRCKMDMPMLDREEAARASELYGNVFRFRRKSGATREQALQAVVDYYREVTGYKGEMIANAVMHHFIHLYGPPCESCGKPYRTPKARICAFCGGKRPVDASAPID